MRAMRLLGVAALLSVLAAVPAASRAQPVEETEEAQEQPFTFYESAHPEQTVLDLVEARLVLMSSNSTKQVLDRSKSLVGLPQPIRVCFMDGTPAQHEFVVQAAQAWVETGAGIRFDFGGGRRNYCINDTAENPSTIRITLRGTKNYSLIGREAFLERFRGKETMAIGFDLATSPAYRRVIVLHEFGHALGLLHEHLNPAASCLAELRSEYIYAKLTPPRGKLTREEVDRDFLAMLRGAPDIENSRFDAKSIMIYAIPDDYFIDPANATCKVAQPSGLSDLDADEIRRHYPTDPQVAARLARDLFEDLQLNAQASGIPAEQQALLVSYAAGFASLTAPDLGDEYLEFADRLLAEAGQQ